MPTTTAVPSKASLWTGRVITGLVAAFLLMDAVMKLFKPAFVVQTMAQLGYRESTIIGIGLSLLVCTLIFLIPRTAVLGAVLLTGYLGGAVATNVRAATPIFNIVFPFILGALIWGSLLPRNPRFKQFLPLVNAA